MPLGTRLRMRRCESASGIVTRRAESRRYQRGAMERGALAALFKRNHNRRSR